MSSKSMTRQKTPKATSKPAGFNGTFGKEQVKSVINQVKNDYDTNSSKARGVQRANAISA